MKNHYLCIDFEMLCNESGMLRKAGTIIEIGACIVDEEGVVARFDTYVLPQGKNQLNGFTKKFLSIDEESFLQEAVTFEQAMIELDKWATPYLSKLAGWITWDDKDIRKIKESYRVTKCKAPRALRTAYIDAQASYCFKNYIYERISLNDALANSGVTHSYKTHRALDDALKLALILPYCTGN